MEASLDYTVRLGLKNKTKQTSRIESGGRKQVLTCLVLLKVPQTPHVQWNPPGVLKNLWRLATPLRHSVVVSLRRRVGTTRSLVDSTRGPT